MIDVWDNYSPVDDELREDEDLRVWQWDTEPIPCEMYPEHEWTTLVKTFFHRYEYCACDVWKKEKRGERGIVGYHRGNSR